MVLLAAVMVVWRTISKIAKSNAHVMVDGSRNCESNTDAEDGMRHGQGVDVSIVKKEQARSETPDQRQRRQHRVWQVRKSEQPRRRKDRRSSTRQQPKEAQQKKIQQKKLL